MLKILIIEDEPIQRYALEQQLAKVYGHKNIYTAKTIANGKNLVDKIKPNLVIQGINLKNNSAFNLISYMKKEYPNIQIIIITAHENFNFAYRALKLGVSDYLLKPVRPSTLLKQIEKITSNKNINVSKRPSVPIWPLLESKLVGEIKYLLNTYPNIIVVGGFGCPIQNDTIFRIKGLIERCLGTKGWLEVKQNLIILYLNVKDEAILTKTLEHIQYEINKEFAIAMRFGIGSFFHELKNILQSYEEAMETYHNLLFFPKKMILTYSDNKQLQYPIGTYPYKIEADILNALKNFDFTSCKHKLSEFIGHLLKSCGNKFDILKKWYEYFHFSLSILCDELGCTFSYDVESDWVTKNDFYGDVVTMLDVAIDAIKEKSHITDPIVIKVIEILNTRFNEDISLDMLSREVGLSPVYLSRLFKEETGQTYKSFITKIRMERAKMLLKKDIQKPIFELAAEVGYSDANYFSEVFKKYQGVSPTQYRYS